MSDGLTSRCIPCLAERVGNPDASEKPCAKCAVSKPLDQFKPDNRSADGTSNTCKECWNAAHRQWRKDNPEAQQRRARRDTLRLHGMTEDSYALLLESQGGTCAICRTSDPGSGSFRVDHDHACCPGDRSCGQCVRGLLCHNCNVALGLLADDPSRLLAAADYVGRSSKTKGGGAHDTSPIPREPSSAAAA